MSGTSQAPTSAPVDVSVALEVTADQPESHVSATAQLPQPCTLAPQESDTARLSRRARVKACLKKAAGCPKRKTRSMCKDIKEQLLFNNEFMMYVCGIMLGNVFISMISSIITAFVTPWFGLILGAFNFESMYFSIGPMQFHYGLVLNSFLVLIANIVVVSFVLLRPVRTIREKRFQMKACRYCLSKVHERATRCEYCLAELEVDREVEMEKGNLDRTLESLKDVLRKVKMTGISLGGAALHALSSRGNDAAV